MNRNIFNKNIFLLSVMTYFLISSGNVFAADPPKITWISPAKEYNILKTAKTNIRASVKTSSGINSAVLYINDVPYGEPEMQPSETEPGTFILSKSVNFEPGDNTVYFVAANNDGTTISEKRYFTVSITFKPGDSTAVFLPDGILIQWTDPLKIRTTLSSPKANIEAKIRSGSGLSSVVLYLNDILYGEPEMSPSYTEPLTFNISKTVSFESGENNIHLIATNKDGTTVSEKRYFTVESYDRTVNAAVLSMTGAPVISWAAPSSLNSTIKSTKTNISAKVKSASGINSVLLFLNDVQYGEPEMNPSETEVGTFDVSKTMNFEPGENNIYLVATNNLGSTTSEKRYFTVEASLEEYNATITSLFPLASISWAVPTVKSTTLRTPSANIKATIKSSSDLASVVLYLNGVALEASEIKPVQNEPGSYAIEKTVNFRQVENNIYIEAKNSGGTARSEIRSFICPPSSLVLSQSAVQTAPKTTTAAPVNVPPVVQEKAVPQPAVSQPAAPLITWTSPSGSHTTLDAYNANVKASIKSSEGLTSVLLYLNGVSKGEADIKPSPDDPSTFVVQKNMNFGPGENQIYLVAANSQGATKSEIRYFTNPSAVVPVIAWSNPASTNTQVNTESFDISACINSPSELSSVKLLVNGSILSEGKAFQASSTGNDCNFIWQGTVILKEGDNSIFLVATNTAGSTTSEKRTIKLSPEVPEKRLALVFGNSNYSGKSSLPNPANDANLMEGTLKELGFEVIKRLDATKNQMTDAIREFNEKLPDYNVALFYYAGHGNQVEGKNYLIPVDAKLEKPSDCKYEAIDVNFIVEEFESYPDNTNIVILDACRDNPYASWTRGGEMGFRAMNFTSGTVVAYATSIGATAADGKGANGLYTQELVKQLMITQSINDVFMNTRMQVKKLSNNTQVPTEDNRLVGHFYFKK
ncbi:MAG: caspase family protein [Bacteroidia bacterium]|nr:caspase family protein [Bacteroidia bacterium]